MELKGKVKSATGRGGSVITHRKVREVKDLLGTGLSLHQVARQAEISYSTVRHISLGHYDDSRPLSTYKNKGGIN